MNFNKSISEDKDFFDEPTKGNGEWMYLPANKVICQNDLFDVYNSDHCDVRDVIFKVFLTYSFKSKVGIEFCDVGLS